MDSPNCFVMGNAGFATNASGIEGLTNPFVQSNLTSKLNSKSDDEEK